MVRFYFVDSIKSYWTEIWFAGELKHSDVVVMMLWVKTNGENNFHRDADVIVWQSSL